MRRIALLLPAVLVLGCAVFRPPGRGLPPPPPSVADEQFDYRLLPGDRIVVKLVYTPQLSEEVLVRTDGRIVLPVAGEVMAGGRTIAELSEDLSQRYALTLDKPDVSVLVKDFGGQRIYVGGEVKTPRMVPLDSVMSVADAVFAAGGLEETAAADCVILLRRGVEGGKPQAFQVDMEAGLFAEVDLPLLQPFDVIYVPKTRIAHLDQYVEQYVNRLIPRNTAFSATYGLGAF